MAKNLPDDETPAAPAPKKKAKPAKPDAETAVQTEAPAKSKKKAKAETGIATKPGFASMFSFSKAAPTGVWGVDLGQCALKAIRLEVIDGAVTATAFDYVEHPKILSQPDADPDELTREALARAAWRASSSCRPSKRRRFPILSNLKPNSRFPLISTKSFGIIRSSASTSWRLDSSRRKSACSP